MAQDMGGLAQMINIIGNNMNVLHQNVQQVVKVVQTNNTKSGIILPNG